MKWGVERWASRLVWLVDESIARQASRLGAWWIPDKGAEYGAVSDDG